MGYLLSKLRRYKELTSQPLVNVDGKWLMLIHSFISFIYPVKTSFTINNRAFKNKYQGNISVKFVMLFK